MLVSVSVSVSGNNNHSIAMSNSSSNSNTNKSGSQKQHESAVQHIFHHLDLFVVFSFIIITFFLFFGFGRLPGTKYFGENCKFSAMQWERNK